MDYEKAYKESLNEAIIAYKDEDRHLKATLERIFPELKKKTDEEMIQKLIAICHLYYGEGIDAERDECLEWLEKQSKNKPIERKEFTSIPFGAYDSELVEETITIPDGCVATIEDNKIHIKKEGKTAIEAIKEEKVDNANKVEPKFKVGDWLQYRNAKPFYVEGITSQGYVNGISCLPFSWEDEIHLWSIADAQDGDILASSDNKAFIYNGNFNEWNVGAYCGLDIYDNFTIADRERNWCCNYKITPATTEQRQALFDEMKLLGWVWNTETKELNRLDKNEENNN